MGGSARWGGTESTAWRASRPLKSYSRSDPKRVDASPARSNHGSHNARRLARCAARVQGQNRKATTWIPDSLARTITNNAERFRVAAPPTVPPLSRLAQMHANSVDLAAD